MGRIDFVTNGVAALLATETPTDPIADQSDEERIKEESREEWAGTDFYGKIFLFDNIAIDDVTVNGPNINITDSEGNIHHNTEVAAILAANPEKAIIIEDKNGDQWVVEKDGDGAKVTKVEGGGLAPGSIINSEDFTIQEKLVVEVLEEMEQKLNGWLNTYGKGPLSTEEMLSFLSLPDDVPKDPEMVEGILKYVNQVKTNPTEFTKKLFEQEGKALNELLKDVEQDQPLKGQLDENQWQQAEKVITKEAVNHGLFNWFTDLPYKERAAKVLKEHLENQGIYDEVWISESNKTTILTKLSLSADATLEQEIDLTNVPEDELFELLVQTYKVPYWEAYDAELKGWDRVVNWLRIQDAKIARKEGWAVAYANFTADVVNAPAGAVQGWITGEHWRTGQELAWWEHILGIVDVIPGEALAKAGITALVIKIGDKAFDLTKVTSATRNFILASKSAGFKLVVKSTNEIILYSAKGTKEIGRFLNGVLQDIYWVYGGEKILAKLSGIKFIVDNKTIDGAFEIVEHGGKTGLRLYVDVDLLKRYFSHIQEITERAVPQVQIDKLKEALRSKKYEKLSKAELDARRLDFNVKKNNLISEWEAKTGQEWPKYIEPYYTKNGVPYKKVGDSYDAHHIIENQYGGNNEWWNIHPARFPDQHQAGIHGADSPARELFN